MRAQAPFGHLRIESVYISIPVALAPGVKSHRRHTQSPRATPPSVFNVGLASVSAFSKPCRARAVMLGVLRQLNLRQLLPRPQPGRYWCRSRTDPPDRARGKRRLLALL